MGLPRARSHHAPLLEFGIKLSCDGYSRPEITLLPPEQYFRPARPNYKSQSLKF
jgi:hypothetical protein